MYYIQFLCTENDTKAITSELKRLGKIQKQREKYIEYPDPELQNQKTK